MTKFLTAPSERPPVENLGPKSPLPESVGCDVVWEGARGMAGCQRKAVADLIASVRDKRLGRELELMEKAKLAYRFLVVEGTPQWDREGNLLTAHTRWSMKQHNGVLLSCQLQGVMVVTSRNPLETCAVIEHLYEWSQKKEHVSSLLARDKAPRNGWGHMDDRTSFCHFFSAVDKISNELSGRIYDTLGNILTLTVGEEELKTVPGIGPERIASILNTFKNREMDSE